MTYQAKYCSVIAPPLATYGSRPSFIQPEEHRRLPERTAPSRYAFCYGITTASPKPNQSRSPGSQFPSGVHWSVPYPFRPFNLGRVGRLDDLVWLLPSGIKQPKVGFPYRTMGRYRTMGFFVHCANGQVQYGATTCREVTLDHSTRVCPVTRIWMAL